MAVIDLTIATLNECSWCVSITSVNVVAFLPRLNITWYNLTISLTAIAGDVLYHKAIMKGKNPNNMIMERINNPLGNGSPLIRKLKNEKSNPITTSKITTTATVPFIETDLTFSYPMIIFCSFLYFTTSTKKITNNTRFAVPKIDKGNPAPNNDNMANSVEIRRNPNTTSTVDIVIRVFSSLVADFLCAMSSLIVTMSMHLFTDDGVILLCYETNLHHAMKTQNTAGRVFYRHYLDGSANGRAKKKCKHIADAGVL